MRHKNMKDVYAKTRQTHKQENRILDCLFVNMVKWLTHLWNKK